MSSGGDSPINLADAMQPGLEETGPLVLVGITSGVAEAGRAGTGVSVGRAETFVNESCACTVCATAVAMSASDCAGLPHEAASKAMLMSRGNRFDFRNNFYFLSGVTVIIPFSKSARFFRRALLSVIRVMLFVV